MGGHIENGVEFLERELFSLWEEEKDWREGLARWSSHCKRQGRRTQTPEDSTPSGVPTESSLWREGLYKRRPAERQDEVETP